MWILPQRLSSLPLLVMSVQIHYLQPYSVSVYCIWYNFSKSGKTLGDAEERRKRSFHVIEYWNMLSKVQVRSGVCIQYTGSVKGAKVCRF
jgi:hypothetical protein